MENNEKKIMFVFPGQGSQYPGMGSDLYAGHEAARDIYGRASEVLGLDMAELSFHDPDDQLNLTRYTQPALLTHSIAALEVFRALTDNAVKPAMAAGHSLGEYSALVAAGALSFEDALRLVSKRGELMGIHGEGEMTAFPMELDAIRPIAERYHCAIAGCNLPMQTVIGGRPEDLEQVEREVTENFPRKRPVRLKTEGAFHTYYMVKAAREYRGVLAAADFDLSDVQVLSNFTGGFHAPEPEAIRSRLFFQLFHPVMWYENLKSAFAEYPDLIFEFGGGIGPAQEPAGKRPNLEGMIKKAMRSWDGEAGYRSVINSQTLRETVEFLLGE
ncbi:MAG: ACP S-malonyltransferase [Lysobacterales bacterium]